MSVVGSTTWVPRYGDKKKHSQSTGYTKRCNACNAVQACSSMPVHPRSKTRSRFGRRAVSVLERDPKV